MWDALALEDDSLHNHVAGRLRIATRSEFRDILRTSNDFDYSSQFLQVMPWPTYQVQSDHDIRVYVYLSPIQPAKPAM
jgi:hypothetical protein